MSDHDFEFGEGVGLPKRLPPGEKILWQGKPDWKRIAIEAFHIRKIAIAVVVLALLRLAWNADASGAIGAASMNAFVQTLMFGGALLALTALIAWGVGRSTVYTLTTGRVVMSYGLLAPIALNLPLNKIVTADMKSGARGTGDISITLDEGTRLGFLHLWPHARPWRTKHPQPTLRAIPNVTGVAERLVGALQVSGLRRPIVAAGRSADGVAHETATATTTPVHRPEHLNGHNVPARA